VEPDADDDADADDAVPPLASLGHVVVSGCEDEDAEEDPAAAAAAAWGHDGAGAPGFVASSVTGLVAGALDETAVPPS